MLNPELNEWLDEKEFVQVIKILAFPDKAEKSEAYLVMKDKLHAQIQNETGANEFTQYWKIIELAAEAGWPVIDEIKEENKPLFADEFSVTAALTWMKEKKIELKPFPADPDNL